MADNEKDKAQVDQEVLAAEWGVALEAEQGTQSGEAASAKGDGDAMAVGLLGEVVGVDGKEVDCTLAMVSCRKASRTFSLTRVRRAGSCFLQ